MPRNPIFIIIAWILVVLSFPACSSNVAKDFDLLIRNGTIVDGTGCRRFRADLGIIDDTVAEIGDLAQKSATHTIDAVGLIVSPGFIDTHTHGDRNLGRPGSNANLNYLSQGVTTVVTGNCGSGTFEIAEIKANWEEQGIGTNAVHLVGFGDLRRAALGAEPRQPEREELEKMRSLLRQAMKEGAWGMSTSLARIMQEIRIRVDWGPEKMP